MNLENLKLFVAVARRGSFAAVAYDLGKAPSSVSRAIAALEEELGVRLLQRNTRRQLLTQAGIAYLEAVEEATETLAQASDQAAALTERPRGVLRVTASATFGQIGILPLLPDFMARYPGLDVELLLTDTRLDLIAERIDIAIRLGHLTDNTLIATKLASAPFRICASPAYLKRFGMPKSPSELAGHDCIHPALPGFGVWRFRDTDGLTVEVAVHSRLICSNALALGQCAVSGMGVTLLPDWVAQTGLVSGELVDLFPNWRVGTTEFEVQIWIVYPSRRHLPLKVRLFIDHVKEAFSGKVPWGAG